MAANKPVPRNLGIIRIDAKLILEWLQFPEGKIRGVRMSDFDASETLEIMIEHPEMPLLQDGSSPMPVSLSYTKIYKRGKLVDIKRDPLR